jgi:nucleotide-binding universal stress UspA family protein
MAAPKLFRTILSPIDFSEHSRQALAYAAALASRSKAQLVVIFVQDPLLATAAAVAFDDTRITDKTRKQLRRFVERTIRPYGISIDSVTLDVAAGRPHELIQWTADKLKCDLIVMGSHGLTGATKLMLGSTTHRLLRQSPLPVLATPPVKGRVRRPPRTWPGAVVIAPVDLDARARPDALAAAVVAGQLGTRLELVHIIEPIPGVPWLELDEARRNQQQRRLAVSRLELLQNELGWAVTGVRIRSGRPAEEIAAIAADRSVGLVMMTRRRGRGLFGPRQGAISYQVLVRSGKPVLALPSVRSWTREIVRRSRGLSLQAR